MNPQPDSSPAPIPFLPRAFYFTVQFPDVVTDPTSSKQPDSGFQEVSGISMEISTEPIEEGGLNSYVHIVPKASRHGNLVLKRGIIAMESDLTDWCKTTLQGDLSTLIEPKTVLVQLLNEKGEVACMWRFNNAYPVKWVVDNLSSTKNDLVIESIELAYSFSTREK